MNKSQQALELIAKFGMSEGITEMETQQPLCGCAITPCNHDIEWKEQMADVGQALMDAIRVHAYPGWSPAQCPSEIVGDLRNECDELRAKLAGASKVVASLVQVARAAWNAADNGLGVLVDNGIELRVSPVDFDAISDALALLDMLPDDKPGFTLNGPARAEWALSKLLCSAT